VTFNIITRPERNKFLNSPFQIATTGDLQQVHEALENLDVL